MPNFLRGGTTLIDLAPRLSCARDGDRYTPLSARAWTFIECRASRLTLVALVRMADAAYHPVCFASISGYRPVRFCSPQAAQLRNWEAFEQTLLRGPLHLFFARRVYSGPACTPILILRLRRKGGVNRITRCLGRAINASLLSDDSHQAFIALDAYPTWKLSARRGRIPGPFLNSSVCQRTHRTSNHVRRPE